MSLLYCYSDDDIFICFVCNESFDEKSMLKTHLIKHIDPFEMGDAFLQNAVDCNGSWNTSYNSNLSNTKKLIQRRDIDLTNEINKRTDVKQKEFHVCCVCGKDFRRKDHLKKHYTIHSGKRPFCCLICKKSFSRKDRLKEHCVIHLSNGWSCYFCGKMFTQRCILRKHEMIHRGVKPFSCELCDSRFSRKNDLLRHRTSHTGEKPHFCEVCGKRFSQKRLVNRHLLIHKKRGIKEK